MFELIHLHHVQHFSSLHGGGPGPEGGPPPPLSADAVWDHFICGGHGDAPPVGCPDDIDHSVILERFVAKDTPEQFCITRELLKHVDSDSDGKLSKDEFTMAYDKMVQTGPHGGPPAEIMPAVDACVASIATP